MLKVGITGNIAAGKSTVEEFLKAKGHKVLNTDDIAHDLLLDEHVKQEIIKTFKRRDIMEKGELSRPKLGKIIFAHEDERKKLEGILHPLIREAIQHYFSAQESREKIVFVSVPLMFEAKFENLFDEILLVYADDDIRIKRLIERNDLSEEMAKNRLGLQMSQDKKKPLVAHIIFNNSSLDELEMQVDDLEENLTKN